MAQPTVIRPRKALADKLNEAHIAGMICTAPFTIGFLLFMIVPMLIDPLSSSDYGAMFAMSTLSILPVVIIFITLQKYLVEGIVTTGLKG